MNKEEQNNQTQPDEEKPLAEEQMPNAAAEETQSTEESPVDELTKWRELAMRTAAEYDNYRKRCVKDREDFTKYANRSLLEELLPVIDNFEMGMQMAGQDTASMIYIGMSMVQKQLVDFLEGQGVQPIATEVGQMFDHNIHEAIMSEPSEQPEGTILRILRKGYNLRGRLLRPANVVTAAAPESEEKKD
ncbi:MAG: nucleotide exchange factor GrpE [Akkermansia sp.]|nr:nucleotide exchange factor GrpE [Akkermansia sp.]